MLLNSIEWLLIAVIIITIFVFVSMISVKLVTKFVRVNIPFILGLYTYTALYVYLVAAVTLEYNFRFENREKV